MSGSAVALGPGRLLAVCGALGRRTEVALRRHEERRTARVAGSDPTGQACLLAVPDDTPLDPPQGVRDPAGLRPGEAVYAVYNETVDEGVLVEGRLEDARGGLLRASLGLPGRGGRRRPVRRRRQPRRGGCGRPAGGRHRLGRAAGAGGGPRPRGRPGRAAGDGRAGSGSGTRAPTGRGTLRWTVTDARAPPTRVARRCCCASTSTVGRPTAGAAGARTAAKARTAMRDRARATVS